MSDLLLIVAGVAGIGTVVEQAGWLVTGHPLVRRRVPDLVRPAVAAQGRRRGSTLDGGGPEQLTLRTAVLTATALTWLNPHVYLDTVLLLGSIANTHGDDRWWFATGAGAASLLWFSGLGFGARLLSPLLTRPRAWQVLDVLIGITMLGIAGLLTPVREPGPTRVPP